STELGSTGPTPSASPSDTPASPATAPSSSPGPGDVVFDGQIDVGSGRKLEVKCVGVGSPTILLEGGGMQPSLRDWPNDFIYQVAQTTTICAYSRAGGGRSAPLAGDPTMAGYVGDAYAMLEGLRREAGVEGPYVFVGWSFGGNVALAETLAHPETTAGLVIL